MPDDVRALYETDEHLWMARQIDALRSGRLHEIDRDSLAEYLTEMTIRDRRELESRLRRLVHHLLKIRFQPEGMSRSWGRTVRDQQDEIAGILKSIPSLRAHAPALLADAYPAAVRNAAAETGCHERCFRRKARGRSMRRWHLNHLLIFPVNGPFSRADKRSAIRLLAALGGA